MNEVQLVECPRDAMQGINTFIETEQKIAYINSILKCGFDTVDFGSFVSPKAIPQMRDTEMVLEGLDLSSSNSKLLAIVANVRGAEDAMNFEEISYIGFPFSISEIFQQRNANSSISQASKRVEELHNLCLKNKKTLVVYISMAFGNPYGDVWNPELVLLWMKHFSDLEIKIISLSDKFTQKELSLKFGVSQAIISLKLSKINKNKKVILDKENYIFYESINEICNLYKLKVYDLRRKLIGSRKNNTNFIYV